jgi:hypothetical protein
MRSAPSHVEGSTLDSCCSRHRERAVFSHRAACGLWGMRANDPSRVDVTASRWRMPRPGIYCHQAALPQDEITAHRQIPVTTAPRTLFDLAAVASRRELERAVHEAEVLRLWDDLSLADLVARYPRRRGVVAIKAILADWNDAAAPTRTELEERFLGFLDALGIPRPETNSSVYARGRRFEADCVAREAPDHRAGRTRGARDPPCLRARPRTRPHPAGRGVARRARHMAPAPRRSQRLAADLRRLLRSGNA